MPTALCDNNHITHWRNTRGSRLSEMRCNCGSPLHQAVYDYATEAWVRRDPPDQPARKQVTCVICGRKRMVPSSNAKVVDADGSYYRDWTERESVAVKAGEAICWTHLHRPVGAGHHIPVM